MRGPNVCASSLGAVGRAIEEADLGHAGFEESMNDRARRAARAEDRHRCVAAIPVLRFEAEVRHVAIGVGVRRAELAVFQPQRVGRANGGRGRVALIDEPKRCFLEWNGDVAAG